MSLIKEIGKDYAILSDGTKVTLTPDQIIQLLELQKDEPSEDEFASLRRESTRIRLVKKWIMN